MIHPSIVLANALQESPAMRRRSLRRMFENPHASNEQRCQAVVLLWYEKHGRLGGRG